MKQVKSFNKIITLVIVKEKLSQAQNKEAEIEILYLSLRKFARRKRQKKYKEIIESKNTAFKIEKNYLVYSKDLASSIRKFLRFIRIMEGRPLTEKDFMNLWNVSVIRGWSHFCTLKKWKPNTKHNQFKNLSVVLRELVAFEGLRSELRDIIIGYNNVRRLDKKFVQMKQSYYLESAKELENEDKWLSKPQLQRLYMKCIQHCKRFVSIAMRKKNGLSKKEAMTFQLYLVFLVAIETIAQRKQVYTYLKPEQFIRRESYDCYSFSPLKEKVQNQSRKEGLPVKNYLAMLVLFWDMHGKPKLMKPGVECDSVWISSNGNAASEIVVCSMIKKLAKLYYPTKNCTPQIMRRIVPSLMFEHSIKTPGKDEEETTNAICLIMNTLRVHLRRHYIRCSNLLRCLEIQNTVIDQLLESTTTSESKKGLEEILASLNLNSKLEKKKEPTASDKFDENEPLTDYEEEEEQGEFNTLIASEEDEEDFIDLDEESLDNEGNTQEKGKVTKSYRKNEANQKLLSDDDSESCSSSSASTCSEIEKELQDQFSSCNSSCTENESSECEQSLVETQKSTNLRRSKRIKKQQQNQEKNELIAAADFLISVPNSTRSEHLTYGSDEELDFIIQHEEPTANNSLLLSPVWPSGAELEMFEIEFTAETKKSILEEFERTSITVFLFPLYLATRYAKPELKKKLIERLECYSLS